MILRWDWETYWWSVLLDKSDVDAVKDIFYDQCNEADAIIVAFCSFGW